MPHQCFAYYLNNLDPIIFRIYDNVGRDGTSGLCACIYLRLSALLWLQPRVRQSAPQRVGDFITGCALFGVIIGGRLGYVFFYKPEMLRERCRSFAFGRRNVQPRRNAWSVLFTLYLPYRHKISWTNLGDNLVVTAPMVCSWALCQFHQRRTLRRMTKSLAMQFPRNYSIILRKPSARSRHALELIHRSSRPMQCRAVRQPQVATALRSIISPRHPSQLYELFLKESFCSRFVVRTYPHVSRNGF